MTLNDVYEFVTHVVINGSINAIVCCTLGFGIGMLTPGAQDEKFARGEWLSDCLVSCGILPLWRWCFPTKDKGHA